MKKCFVIASRIKMFGFIVVVGFVINMQVFDDVVRPPPLPTVLHFTLKLKNMSVQKCASVACS